MANSTAGTIIGLIRSMLRADSGSDVPVLSDSFLLTAITDGNLKYANAFSATGEAPVTFQREFGVTLIPETTLSVAAATTDVTLSLVSSASYPASGAVVTWTRDMPDVINYTSNAANVLSGVTGIGFAHSIGDAVQNLYALPSTFGSFREEPTYGDGVRVNGMALAYTGGPPTPGFFSMYDDGTTKYLWLARQVTGYASVLYNKSSATIALTTDTVDVPLDYQMFLVWHALALCYVGREKDFNLRAAALKEAEAELQRCLQSRNIHRKIRPRSFRRSVGRDYTTLNNQTVSL